MSNTDPQVKYDNAIKTCDDAWAAYQASGYDASKRAAFKEAHGNKVKAYRELLNARKEAAKAA